ncbi:MAG: NADH/ubiquinone/plastoquinone (complex I) [Planctomycetes bacterium]|nr:NADH/ubiquinone/plastoquinone (complex I) [Planctomycetota bacterium]
MDHTLPLLVAIPLGVGFLMPLLEKLKEPEWLMDLLATLAGAVLLALSLSLIGVKDIAYWMGGWDATKGIVGIELRCDGLTRLMLVTIGGVALAAILFSLRYMRRYTSKGFYFCLFFLMVAGMNGTVLAGDLFNLYVFLEVAAISSYALVAFGCESEELEASFKYLVLGGVASTFVLFGIGILYNLTGTLNMAAVRQQVAALADPQAPNLALYVAAGFFVMGLGLKAAMVPFHAWLPDAHPSAPAPISAMLSGVLIKALGVYALARLFFTVLGPTAEFATVLMALGGLSMLGGVLLAVGQWDFKRLLAYHSISQMGYVVLALGIGAAVIAHGGPKAVAGLAIFGGLFHLFNHAAFKSLLFLCSGATEYATGTRQLKELGGLAHKMPITSGCCRVASLSIAGVPPFNGFWSKLIIIVAAVQAGYLWLAALATLVAFLTLVSFVKVQRYVIAGELPPQHAAVREVPASMCVAMVALAVVCLAAGLLAPYLMAAHGAPFLDQAVAAIAPGWNAAASLALGGPLP